MISQRDVLGLTEHANEDCPSQRRIKEILLAVAGMIDGEGRLVDEPVCWPEMMSLDGQYGRGCRAVERRKCEQKLEEERLWLRWVRAAV